MGVCVVEKCVRIIGDDGFVCNICEYYTHNVEVCGMFVCVCVLNV